MTPDNDTIASAIRTAIAAHQAGRISEAEAGYHRVLTSAPENFDAQHLLGVIALQRGAFDEAARLIAGALSSGPANPDFADAYNNLAVALRGMGRPADALFAYQQVITLKPDHADAHFNLGNLYYEAEKHKTALASYDDAVRLRPARADAHYGRAVVLAALERREEALAACRQAYRLTPEIPFLFGLMVSLKAQVGDWQDLESDIAQLAAQVSAGKPALHPFLALGLLDSPSLQRACARTWMDTNHPGHERQRAPVPAPGNKLRVGYFSMDFRNHLVGAIAADIFKRHDRSKFELYAFSYGPDTHGGLRGVLEATVDRFMDVRGKSDAKIAAIAREIPVDIAVDLAGHTKGARPGIFAARPAAVQVAYTGGTFGSLAMDYIIADRTVIPETARSHYFEKTMWLPHSFLHTGGFLFDDITPTTRAACSLPETVFVFCCFNTATKIMPSTFACWMRILARAPHSVLWLTSGTPTFIARQRGAA